MKKTGLLAALAAAAAVTMAASRAEAQVFTPTFMAPRVSNDAGIYYSDIGDFGLEGIFRGNFGGTNLGLRVGAVDAGDTFLTLGGELRSPLSIGTAPLDLSLIAGVQGLLGDDSAVGVQGGVSLGYTFVSPELSLTPYIAPRIALTNAHPDNDFDADFLADIGFDLNFNRNLSLRLGIGLGDETADWGLGLSWRR